mgnify:CR=1 FL=1
MTQSYSEQTPKLAKNRPLPRRRHALGWGAVLLAWVLLLGWLWWTPSPTLIETVYSEGIYPWLTTLTALTMAPPVSLALVLAGGLLFGFPLLWLCNWVYRRRARGRSHWAGLFWGFKWGFILVPFLGLWFFAIWGAGYRRPPAEVRLRLDPAAVEDADADRVLDALLELVNQDLPEEARDRGMAVRSVAKAMKTLVADWEHIEVRLPEKVRATPRGLLMANGTSGVCAAFTLEPHVDGGLPDAAFVAVAAHELAHVAGINGEAEANLMGYAAGLRAGDAFARYAVALDTYTDLARGLNPQERKEALRRLPPWAIQDLKKAAEAYKRYRFDWFAKASWRTYDRYLKSQGIKEGVRDYARGVRLLLQAWRAGLVNGLPAPEAAPKENAAEEKPQASPAASKSQRNDSRPGASPQPESGRSTG